MNRLAAALGTLLLIGLACLGLLAFMAYSSMGLFYFLDGAARHGPGMILLSVAGSALATILAFGGAERCWLIVRPSSESGGAWKITAAKLLAASLGLVVPATMASLKMQEMGTKRGEAQMKGTLGSIRSALSIYYGDLEGQYPRELEALTVGGKYMQSLPRIWTGVETMGWAPLHHPTTEVALYPRGIESTDSGKWGYVYPWSNEHGKLGDANTGVVFVDCTHTDTKGSIWTEY